MTRLSICNSPEMEARQQSILDTLEMLLEMANKGELQSVEIIYTKTGGKSWDTVASSSPDSRISAAMLMELAIRRLGFGSQS